MTKKCVPAGSVFVIRASSFLRHFKYDELACSLANPDRAAGERHSHHAVYPSMEGVEQYDFSRRSAREFYL